MLSLRFVSCRVVPLLCVVIMASTGGSALGQQLADDMVGQTSESWALWQQAIGSIEREQAQEADDLLGQVLALSLTDLRLSLMADRSGSLRLEQLAETEDAGDNIKSVVDKIKSGTRKKQLAEDGWHYAAIGRFEYANASFKALDDSNPDPVALLELARRNPNRHLLLVKLVANAEVGPAAKRMIELLNEGEERLRTDPYEITVNVGKLGGTPRMVHNAAGALKRSGEYAIPHLLRFLRDSEERPLHPAIIKVLPQIGRGALNPSCLALGMSDAVSKQVLIDALARIGYRQPLPYLAKLAHSDDEQEDVRAAARRAIRTLGESLDRSVSELFLQLAEAYYSNEDSLQASPAFDEANVWYLHDDKLSFVAVPTRIFNDIMAMRCCEEALKANPDNTEATALWLAANFRREAKLGLNVESDAPDALAGNDVTRPDGHPRAIYFARAAGPMYNHRVLARAVRDRDPGVALGAIHALSATAGEPSLVGSEDIKQALVQALAFPNRQVRFKAAEALGLALPKTPFAESHNVMPVFAEALTQSGRTGALIVDPGDDTRPKFLGLFRALGFECAAGSALHEAQSDADRLKISSFDVIVLASDIKGPQLVEAIDSLRRNFATAATPILIVGKPAQTTLATNTARNTAGVEAVMVEVFDVLDANGVRDHVLNKYDRASKALGMTPLGKELSHELALRTADALRGIAEDGRTVFDFERAVPALIKAMANPAEDLRVKCAHTLALSTLPEAQAAIARSALDETHARDERVKAFGSMAESARRNGKMLNDELIQQIIKQTMTEKDLILQAAASKALGALDLPSNKASEIIRTQSRG